MNALAILYGMFLWALATTAAWLAGPLIFAGGWVTATAFTAGIPLVWGLLHLFWRVTATMPADRLLTGALIALPGLFADVAILVVAPDLLGWTPATVRLFASWLLWIYGLALTVSIRAAPKSEPEIASPGSNS